MYRTLCVMALVVLCTEMAHSFSWVIIAAVGNRLDFFDNKGSLTHTEKFTLEDIHQIIYDPVHNRVLFTDHYNVYSFDIATKKTEYLIKRVTNTFISNLAYDPATQLLFMLEHGVRIYSISLKPKSNNFERIAKFLILNEDRISKIAVDSCGGFIYYTTDYTVRRVRFYGSENELVIDNVDDMVHSLNIYSQKLYWSDSAVYIKSADLNGENTRKIIRSARHISFLTVSKDYIYCSYPEDHYEKHYIMQIPKNSPRGINMKPTIFIQLKHWPNSIPIATNYNIEDIIQENHNCDSLKSLLPNNSVSTDNSVSLLHVHGTRVSGESRCECAQGYSGERCDVSVCHNYCLHGDCSASAEGLPKCRCNPGYSGERCELNECQGYCFRGDCSAGADGHPKCSCNAGYSGQRCQVDVCQGYCLNDGICSLSAESKPICRCTGHYEGERCHVPLFQIKFYQAISLLKDILNTDVSSDIGVKSSCASTAV